MTDPDASRPPVSDPADSPAAWQGLKLEAPLQLLARSGHQWSPGVVPGSTAWMQELVDALLKLSSKDPLTGLANRRQFELTLDREIDRVARSGEAALVLLLDIDHFKRVNDTHGHAAGDVVIQAVGRLLQECVRPMDTVARVGGEEFAVVLPNCPAAFGRTVAERIRRRVELETIAITPPLTLKVTISIGGAFAPQWVRSSARLWMERADQQLYRAKQGGRNRASLEAPPVSVVSAEEKGLLFATPSDFLPDPAAEPNGTAR